MEKKGDQLLDVEMQKQKKIWSQDAKRYNKTTTSHIYFTYWPYQVCLRVYHPYRYDKVANIQISSLQIKLEECILITQPYTGHQGLVMVKANKFSDMK